MEPVPSLKPAALPEAPPPASERTTGHTAGVGVANAAAPVRVEEMVADAVRVFDMVTVGVDEPELLLVCVFVPLLVCEPEPVRVCVFVPLLVCVLVDDSATEAEAEFELVREPLREPLVEPVGVIELGDLVAVSEPLNESVGIALGVGGSDDDCAAVGGLQRKRARVRKGEAQEEDAHGGREEKRAGSTTRTFEVTHNMTETSRPSASSSAAVLRRKDMLRGKM